MQEHEPSQVATEPSPSGSWRNIRWWNPRQTVLTWLPLCIALISLGMGFYNFVVAQRVPDVLLILPDQVRIAQGGASGPLLYMQPAFVASGPGARPELVVGMTLRVQPLDQDGPSVSFAWREQGGWDFDQPSNSLTWRYSGDAAPFLIGPQSPALFTALLIGPQGWRFTPGRYRLTLVAERVVNQRPLEGSVVVTLEPEPLEFLNQSEGRSFRTFPVDRLR